MTRQIVSISLPPSLATKARVEAAKLNISRSKLIRRAIRKYLRENETTKNAREKLREIE